jgi:hypothetical protein
MMPLTDQEWRPSEAVDAGLSSAEAARRLAQFGPNELRRERAVSPVALLARQFGSPVIWLLLAALGVSLAAAERLDALAIGAIVLLNAATGFSQERRAERAVAALRSMTAPRARVRRDGRSVVRPAAEVVPGDLLLLEPGDVVAADARLRTAHALTTNEASLTGESTPAEESAVVTTPETPLADRHDFVFMGTAVAGGSGVAEVSATGMRTELGRIAHLLAASADMVTPLQRRLTGVSQTLIVICGAGSWRSSPRPACGAAGPGWRCSWRPCRSSRPATSPSRCCLRRAPPRVRRPEHDPCLLAGRRPVQPEPPWGGHRLGLRAAWLHHVPAAQAVFEIGPWSAADCALSLAVGLVPVSVIEIGKMLKASVHHDND